MTAAPEVEGRDAARSDPSAALHEAAAPERGLLTSRDRVLRLRDKRSFLSAAVLYLFVTNLKLGERGQDFENISAIEMSAYFTDTGIIIVNTT